MVEAAAELRRRAANILKGDNQLLNELMHIVRPRIRQFAFGKRPHPLIWIQLWCVRRKIFYAKTRIYAAEHSERFSPVSARIVKQGNDGPTQVTQEVTEEPAHFSVADIAREKAEIQTEALTAGTDRDSRYDRDLISAIPVTNDRRPAARRPGPKNVGNQQESGFIAEDNVGAQPRGVFFILGHSAFFQCSMASSFRSNALRSGFWWLHPRECISRPTWSGWYFTPNSASITSASRAVVHNSVEYPYAIAPLSNSFKRRRRCSFLSFQGRPGENRTSKAFAPLRLRASRQRITELGAQLIIRPTSLIVRPSSRRDRARRRRSCIRSAEPFGLGMRCPPWTPQ